MAYTRERIGQLLVKSGVIDVEQLRVALEMQGQVGGKIGSILVDQLMVSEDQIADALARQKDISRIRLSDYKVDRDAAAILPQRVARRREIIPIGYDADGAVIVAMADPLDIEALDEVELRAGRRAVPVVATASAIAHAIDKYMAQENVFAEVIEMTASMEESADEEIDARLAAGADVPIVRLVNQIVREALVERASDVHFEPFDDGVRVRYRVDGVLHEVMRLPKSARAEMTSRIKIMADMNITERRRPQDGRILLHIDSRSVDLRVATLPTPHGESIVVRVLNQGLAFHDLEELGMNPAHLATVEALLRKPYGAIFVAGPTGSGKSTTLYAAVKRINDSTRKIITVEEPVEYQMDGVTQISVNNAIGLTFAAGLRQILRSDPDVVMIGEVRDPETAEIAVRAALTGHLVLTSIHTNDAPSVLTRLTDMEVAPYITSSAVLAVISQRLVRVLCPHCKKETRMDADAAEALGFEPERLAGQPVFEAVGCDRCIGTGYRGRLGVFEIMVLDDEARRLFLHQAPSEELRALAIRSGMRTLREDALEKVLAGTTSAAEVARVVM